jgi:hypothetical protein
MKTGFSTTPYIAIVIFVIVVNLWLLIRFLLKASKWGNEKPDDKEQK